jgi:predicted dienelactone hydrolase
MPRRSFVLLLSVALFAVLAPAAPGAATPERTYSVAAQTFTFVDTTRATPANGSYPGAPTRTLSTLVLYPTEAQPSKPFPLVVFSHGFTASGPAYQFLLQKWAAHGYVIAAPTFPLSNGNAPGGPTIGDYPNQPGDVSFVITSMLNLSRDPRSPLHGLINANRIGVAGHSLGAITTLGVAYNSAVADPRIDAAVPISGIVLPFGTGTTFTGITTPLLLIHGDHDQTVPYGSSVYSFEHASPPKFFETLLGAPHTPFLGPWAPAIDNTVIAFLDKYLKHNASDNDIVGAANVPGLSTLQMDDPAPLAAHAG